MRKWSNAEIIEMLNRMRARSNGFRISPETAPLVIEALDRLASDFTPTDRLRFFIEWVDSIEEVRECLAMTKTADLAIAAYDLAVAKGGTCKFILRERGRIMRRSWSE